MMTNSQTVFVSRLFLLLFLSVRDAQAQCAVQLYFDQIKSNMTIATKAALDFPCMDEC